MWLKSATGKAQRALLTPASPKELSAVPLLDRVMSLRCAMVWQPTVPRMFSVLKELNAVPLLERVMLRKFAPEAVQPALLMFSAQLVTCAVRKHRVTTMRKLVMVHRWLALRISSITTATRTSAPRPASTAAMSIRT